MTSPVGNFRDLTRALEAGSALPDHVVVWLHDGCARFYAGEVSSLDIALGIRGQGINLPVNQYAWQTRDMELAAAYQHIEGRSERARLQELRRQIRAFGSRTWPRVRAYSEPPDRLTPLQVHLFRAFQVGQHIPESVSRLRDVVRSNRPYS
ncbi:hypothetical protein [Salinisphaera sp. Q1T1-3]|uniref:hypothetical protein n=1 Tax=Salinisphaera sp. Q1T1-3 TaxID=2321229 RepID=UPI000E71BA63|nr:hypothetical protein [Salinisphaera sp. Q1T1-3]RJS95281.1 hypothetical protein D3260_01645 [Salinisphaera sp. Q1T1-3]